MSDHDKIRKDIKDGKGIPPLVPSTNQSKSNGISTEQRGHDSGLSYENFSLNQPKKDDNNT